MPIVKCVDCRRRYDPGVEVPDDLPDEHSLVVCCPACGQWMTLPDREPADPPDVPRHVRDQMKRQATLVDDDDDRPRRRRRDDDDDDDYDDRPRRRRGRDDDEYDDRPARRRGGKKSPLPWVIGGLVALMLLVGCGVGGYFVVSGVGGGPITVTQASRQANTVEVHYTVAASAKPGTQYRVVAACQGRKSVLTRDLNLAPNSRGRVSWTANELAGTTGTVEVWFEETGGRKASNVLTFQ
jgi:hypothetical protein